MRVIPGKSMYHFYLQQEGQPAQISLKPPKLELFQIDRLSMASKIPICREVLERKHNLINPCITSVCKQEESQPAQLFWIHMMLLIVWHLICFAEHAVSIRTFFGTQESFQESKMKDVCRGDF